MQLDDDFAFEETLLDDSPNCLLNQLGRSHGSIYNSNRSSMSKDLYRNWCNAQYDAQKAINSIASLLLYDERVYIWLGEYTFTGRSLFSRMVGELFQALVAVEEGADEEERKLRQEFLETQETF